MPKKPQPPKEPERQPWQGIERTKSQWLLDEEEAREKEGKRYIPVMCSLDNITRLLVTNITTFPNFVHKKEKETIDGLLEWARKPQNRNNCFRWDGKYYQNRPAFPLVQRIPVDNLHKPPIPSTIFMELFLFEWAFGPWPARKPLRPTRNCLDNGIGMPRGINDAAWCVNPYHKVFNLEDSPRTNRDWNRYSATVKKYNDYHKQLPENQAQRRS